MWKLNAGDEVWNILYSGRRTGIQESWWRQAVPGAVQRGFRKEVKRKNSQYRKVRNI